jgi:Na+-driven multidrug efflux pump
MELTFSQTLWHSVVYFFLAAGPLIAVSVIIAQLSRDKKDEKEKKLLLNMALFMTIVVIGVIVVTWYYAGPPRF